MIRCSLAHADSASIQRSAYIAICLALLTGCNHASWNYQWEDQQPLQTARRALAATASGDYLYALGGVDADGHYVNTVEVSHVLPDGRLEPWRFTTPLPSGRIYHAAVVAHNDLYVLGGGQGELGDNNTPVASVEKSHILPNGQLSEWQPASPLTTPRRGLQVVALHDALYAIGGYNGTFLKSVERAQVSTQGALSPWQLEPQHAVVDRYIHSATQLHDALYLLGGHVQGSQRMSYGDVEMTRIGERGQVLAWNVEKTSLRAPRFMASAFALSQHLYMLGGHSGGNRLTSVEFAPVEHGGHVGLWRLTTALPIGRSATAVAVHGDDVYVVGGVSDSGILNSVVRARADSRGHLGIPRTATTMKTPDSSSSKRND
ncbi:MAG: hypothetical protein HY273_11360 [Gammaproteobacteria bacterium]|nr:hypothetical protein [Gammaproteobacteria bacterium]